MEGSAKGRSIVLGGGCFWCMEAVFRRSPGILSVGCGYAGGDRENPSYEQVCTGLTGHAEVIEVVYDPSAFDDGAVLDLFFAAHDPTTEDRQGADIGHQYRSIILYSDEAQKKVALQKIRELDASGRWPRPIVTEVVALERFWPAEEYHQDYYEKHPYAGYCRVVIAPKLEKAGLPPGAIEV